MPIYRISLVYMYYAKPPTKKTPDPYAEVRTFVFKTHPLTRLELQTIKKGLRAITERTVRLFSIYDALLKDRTYHEEEMKMESIEGKIVAEIHGFEVEEVDYDEVAEYFKSRGRYEIPKVIPFDVPFRYVRFYSLDGEVKAEYNEWDIREKEKEPFVAARILSREMIRFLQEEYFPLLRELEEYRERYEKIIEKIRGGV